MKKRSKITPEAIARLRRMYAEDEEQTVASLARLFAITDDTVKKLCADLQRPAHVHLTRERTEPQRAADRIRWRNYQARLRLKREEARQ